MKDITLLLVFIFLFCSQNLAAQIGLFSPNRNEINAFTESNQLVMSYSKGTEIKGFSTNVALGYSPLKGLAVVVNKKFGTSIESFGGAIGGYKYLNKSFTYSNIDSFQQTNWTIIDIYATFDKFKHKYSNTLFRSTLYGIQSGIHWKNRKLVLSLIARLNITDVTSIYVVDNFYYSQLIAEITQKDPYTFVETIGKVQIHNRYYSFYAQFGSITSEKRIAIENRVFVKAGVNIHIHEFFKRN